MKSPKLTLIQCEVLVGILLGDASLQTESRGRTYRLRVIQGENHKEYLFHLYEIFKNFTTSPPKRNVNVDKRNPHKEQISWSFATTQQPCFRFYGQQFYDKDGEKIVPRCIHKLLKPRSMAYWYMDDGALKWKNKSKGVRFCTDSFSRSEVKLLATLLEKEYQLKTSLNKQRNNWRIAVSTFSHGILKKLIWHFLIASMRYKFPE